MKWIFIKISWLVSLYCGYMVQNPSSKDPVSEVRSPVPAGVSPLRWVFLALIVVLIILAGFIIWSPGSPLTLLQNGTADQKGNPTSPSQTGTPSPSSFSPAAGARVFDAKENSYVTYVYYTGDAFIPDSVTITGNEKVRFVNATNLTMRVGSRAEALSSNQYSSLSQPSVKTKGQTFDMTLGQPGIWSYENLPSTDPRVLGVVYVR